MAGKKKIESKIPPEDIGKPFELDAIDRLIIEKKIKYPDITHGEIADAAGVTIRTIQYRMAKPEFRRAMLELNASTEDHLKEAAVIAARRLKKILTSENPSIIIPAIKMALHKFLSKSEIDLTVTPKVVYSTSIEADGTLLREVVESQIDSLGKSDGSTDTTKPSEGSL